MKRTQFLLLTLALFATPIAFAETAPADEVKAAVKKLAEAENYSWATTTTVPEGTRFRPGAASGKTNKDGFSWLSNTMGDRTTESIVKAGKSVTKGDAGWQTPEERRAAREAAGGGGGGGEGRGGRGGRNFENFKTPAQQAEDLVGKVKELKKDGDAYVGELNEEAVQSLISMGRGGRRGGGGGDDAGVPPAPTDAKGTVKFWLKDGALAKMETKVSGKLSFNGNDIALDRTTTTEIKDVGTTALDIPEDAKKKL
ncbi:MAG: hypothetical protein ACKV19_25315 [Verrucomicrobiales bacterium]